MSSTPHILANGDLVQDWSNLALISVDDNWSNVGAIVGHLGDINAGTPTGVDPRTLTAADLGAVDVIANQTNPNTLTAGGVAEFSIANPTVALNGSGTADAPSLVVYLDATGRSDVRLQFNARDIDGGADNALQQIAVQYRLGGSSTWTNVVGGYGADVTGASAASQVTPFDLLLPAEVNGRADLQIRILTTNAIGSDEWVGIDDIHVTSQPNGGGNETQALAFASGSLDVAVQEGDAGSTMISFTIERTGGTEGDVTFSGTLAPGATDGADFVGGDVPTSFSGSIPDGATSVTVTVAIAGDTVVEGDETFTLTLDSATNASASITLNLGSATVAQGTILNDEISVSKISEVQGSGTASTKVGQTVTVEAIVVGDFQNADSDGGRNLGGFWLQEESYDQDGNLLTSEGIFVAQGSLPTDVQIGDRVRVTGTVTEAFGNTEINATDIVVTQADAVVDVDSMAVDIDLSGSAVQGSNGVYTADLEAYEGMLVRIPETLTITEQFNLDRFGETRLTQGERPDSYTMNNEASVSGYDAHLRDIASSSIILDDGRSTSNPSLDNVLTDGEYTTANAPRMGDTVTGLTGVLDFDFSQFRIHTVESGVGVNDFVSANPRPATPADVGGTIQVASFNVLNYFTTLNNGSGTVNGQAPRGAETAAEFARQTEKLVNVIATLDADVLGLMELQNNFIPGSPGNAIEYLVAQLNAKLGAGTYAWVDPGQPVVGGDAIAVGFIYKPAVVQIASGTQVAILDDSDLSQSFLQESTIDAIFNGANTSRAAVAVTFEEVGTGGEFTAVVNHLKSKGDGDNVATGADNDILDGNGAWNQQRTLAAEALRDWMATNPTGSQDADVMILGDLNAYNKEDPIDVLVDAGYTDQGADGYGYVFDGQTGSLDHILTNGSLSTQVTGVTEWHINADEADAIDYQINLSGAANSAGERDPDIFDADVPGRVSDHDPIVVGIDLTEEPVAANFKLQLLHASDFEAGLDAVDRAGNFAAIVDYLEETHVNSITLSSGDNFLPSPFFNAGSDASLKEVYETALEDYYNLAPGSLNITPGFGTADISMLNIIGVQASAIGNHEFDAGTNPFAAIIRQTATFPGAQFPYLSANLDFSADVNLSGLYTNVIQGAENYTGFPPAAGIGKKIAPATIITENGEKIGVVGATTQIVESISSTGGVEVIGDDVNDMVALAAILQPTIDALLAQGINKIIVVSHLQQIALEKALAPLLHGVDIIVAGGSNTRMADAEDVARGLQPGDAPHETYPFVTQNADGKATVIVNTDGEYSYVGRLVVEFDANGDIVANSIDANVSGAYATTDDTVDDLYANVIDVDHDGDIDAADADPFASGSRGDLVNDIAQGVGAVIDAQDGNIFGKTNVYLEGRRGEVRTEETNLGNLTADANLWYAQKADQTVMVSIKNGGGLRDSIGHVDAHGGTATELPPSANPGVGKEEGEVSQLDIANSLRFNNALSLVTVTAEQLLLVLEHAVRATTATATPGQFAQIGGISYSFDKDLPAGERVLSAALIDENGNPFMVLVENGALVADPSMAIRMVTLSFLLTGGDSYPFPAFITADPAFANVVSLSAALVPDAGQVADFAGEGTEQDALAEYMAEFYSDTAYAQADTDRTQDERIQNMDFRNDTVLTAESVNETGGAGDDVLTGALADDILSGNGGNDRLYGYAGDDILKGGAGFDLLDGGAGSDTADYSEDAEGIYVRLDQKWATAISNKSLGWSALVSGIAANQIEHDDLIGIENITGTNFRDLIAGDSANNVIKGGAGDDYMTGLGGDDVLEGGEGNDRLFGDAGSDRLDGGVGNDRIVAGAGDQVYGGEGNDSVDISAEDGSPALLDGGEGDDTIHLLGTGAGALGAATGFENLVVQSGTWSVAGSDVYSAITIEDGGTVTSTVTLNADDELTIEEGGKLVSATAIIWAGGGDAVVDNAGLIEASSRVLNTVANATGSFTFNNEAGGVMRGSLNPQQRAAADATITINNAGIMEASGRVIDFQNLVADGADVTINNLAGGTIRQTGSDTDVIRPGQNTVVNNWGTISTAPGFAGGGDLIDYQSSTGGKVNNYAGGWMEGSRHVVTGDNAVTVVNSGTMIGRNGSAVNIDNGGSEAEKVFVTNHGTMEGRSATLSDSDGDAVDVDGLAQILNYGRIAGLGANGRHDGEPNVSEGIAIGGGTILNYGANAEIYGYGRAIQVDNSSNSNALGKTFINNDGLIKGDGHGPEGVTLTPAEVAKFDLRGNEAINLVGDYNDEILNQSTGRIVGGVSMGGGNDHLQSLGSFTATGGSAIDMGAGNDTVYFYTGTTVQGAVLLGTGDDLLLSTANSGFVIDAGDGNDQIYLDSSYSGDDVIAGGAGNDTIYAGSGDDQIDGGADNDTLSGELGDDEITGGLGNDVISGGAGNDRIFAGAGDTVDGGADDDFIEIAAEAGAAVSIDGGDGNDTIVNMGTIQGSNGIAVNAGAGDDIVVNFLGGVIQSEIRLGAGDDQFFGNESAENVDGGEGGDLLSGGGGSDTLSGGDGADVYSYVLGDGSDVVVEGAGVVGDVDLLLFDEVEEAGVTLQKHGSDVEVVLADGSVITLKDQLAGGGIENIVFSDGAILDRDDVEAALVNRGPVAEGEVLTAVQEDAPSFLISFETLLANDTDADLDALSITALADIVGGTAVIEGTNVRFTPAANYHGPASFAYTVSDTDGSTSIATASFNITSVEDVPVVVTSAPATTAEDTPVSGQIIASDGDGDTLTFAVKTGAGPAHGGITIDAAGNWTYTPEQNYNGQDSFTVVVSDGDDLVETVVNLSVTPANDAPTAVSDTGTAGENETKLFDVLANDSDVEGGALSLSGFSVTGVSGIALDNAQAQAAFSIDNGKLAFDGSDLFDSLEDGDTATVTVSYTVQDAQGASSTAEFVLTVTGAEEANIIVGNGSANALFGTNGMDIIDARGGGDYVFGRGGSDVIDAGDGADFVFGGAGNDIIDGGAGKDTLFGDAGDDVISGGEGNDLLYGGAGNDTFVFHRGEGRDMVFDFHAGTGSADVIELDADLFADFTALMQAGAVTDTALGAQVSYDDGSSLTLVGVNKANLTIDDFRFA